MRILMFAPQPFYEDRGTPIATRRVIEAITANGHTVDLLTYPGGESLELPGLTVTCVGKWLPIKRVPIGFSIRKLILGPFLVPAAIRRLRQNHYDCIHALEEAAFPALLLSKIFKVPLLYDMQSALPEALESHWFLGLKPAQRILEFFERILIRNADQIACSAGLNARIRKVSGGVPVFEWRYPCDELGSSRQAVVAEPDGLGLPKRRFVVLYTGNFEAYQGLDVLAEAIPHVLSKLPHAIFVFVGATVDDRLRNLPVEASHAVRLIERQPRSKLSSYFAVADVLVSPRDSIGNLPLKVLEYMVTGKPIVATDCDAHRSVLDDDKAVLVAQCPEAISAAIVGLQRNPQAARQLGRRARAYALSSLGWSRFVRDVERLYRQTTRGDYGTQCQTV